MTVLLAPVTTDAAPHSGHVQVAFCGEWWTVGVHDRFDVGREGDLALDDNPFLHRRFLSIEHQNGLWWLSNVGGRLSATVTDGAGGVQAWLSPGSRLPIVFEVVVVIFTAGPTTYEFAVHSEAPPFRPAAVPVHPGVTTVGATSFTEAQLRMMLALAEPVLRREGTGTSAIPSSARAAARLGWTLTRFNRKLDNVCEKLDRAGVPGLRGGAGALASNRRARLVEYAVSSHVVVAAQLPLLDRRETDLDEAR